MGSFDVTLLLKVGKNCYGLEGFTKTHIVRQNSIDFVVIERNHPLQGIQLVGMQGPSDDAGRLGHEAHVDLNGRVTLVVG